MVVSSSSTGEDGLTIIRPQGASEHTTTDTDQTVAVTDPHLPCPLGNPALHPLHGKLNDHDSAQGVRPLQMAASASVPSTSYSAWSAWMAVVGCVCLTMPTYGLMSAFGLFQVYWETHQLADYNGGNSDAAIAWISSLLGFLNCFFGLFSGILLDRVSSSSSSTRGLLFLLAPHCVVYWASFLALAWCSTYGQFMACMVVAGIASALPSVAAFTVVDHIFETSPTLKHSAAATGVVSTGAPLGGLLFSLMLRALLARTAPSAWQVSMFCLSSVIGVMELIACVLVVWGSRRPSSSSPHQSATEKDANGPDGLKKQVLRHKSPLQTPPMEIKMTVTETTTIEQADRLERSGLPLRRSCSPVHTTPWYANAALWDADNGSLSHFTDRGFWLFTICVFANIHASLGPVYEFVLFTQWGSLPYFAARTGLGDVFYFQMVYNIGALPGRTIPSWLATRFGPFNMTLAMTALTILTIFVVWVPFGDHSTAALYLVAFFMGVGTGSFVPLAATCISRLCHGRGFGKWLGSCYAIVSIATLIGNPVSQALIEKTSARCSVIFQGVLLVVSFVLCLLVRRGDIQRLRARRSRP
ncbi:hypothetical protein SPBR_03428 [Sporothrix brasiliensis 5110]|uniref:Major facilitator superfamily (MFS) profile domain-containing protein n=1 Tax=Sporothrix brasiliensis 5110 TaxID=1398154 RepID=A0A0C2FVX3_9PEZI|nr:uncharacterized protein SPBR_03428 [Sporothrix brasiliensis 5110]KIH95128.1 hypothetical protein SPBR_03428 [Sporothrix brasiliensis 5110]